MRLIDADLLTDGRGVFSKCIQVDFERGPYVTAEDLIKVIDNTPTAFDLESVIEQLEEKALEHAINGQQHGESGYDIHEREEQGIKQGIEIAIKIIKSAANATDGKNGD